MAKLSFFSRLAFLCNICFLVTFIIRYVPALKDGIFVSTIIVIGLVMAIVINVIINLFYLLIIVADKPISHYVPLWLVIINFLFFVFQVILLMK